MGRALIIVAVLACVAGASAVTVNVPELDATNHAILHNHVKMLKNTNAHLAEDVPIHVRGENMTVQNLHRYLTAVPHVELVHPETGEVVMGGIAFDSREAAEKSVSARKLLQTGDPEIDAIIAIGKQVWKVVDDNKPVLSISQTAQSSAVPEACRTNWQTMAGFKERQTYDLRWSWVNGFGSTVVDFSFAWSFKSDGKCKPAGGVAVGSFLRDCGVINKNIHVSWAYTVDVNGKTFSPYNIGTHENPIAAMDLEVTMRHSTVLVDNVQTCRVTMRGNGSGRTVSCDQYPYWRQKY